MGKPKALLPVGGRPMLMVVLEPLIQASTEGVVMVTHSDIAKHLPPQPDNVHVILNEDPSSHMIDSIRLGLKAWDGHAAPQPGDGFLICPADQPGLTETDVERCIESFREAPDRIIVASNQGRWGHPLIFPAAMTPFVQSGACDEGLRTLPHQHAESVQLIACDSPAVLRNINTPEDYQDMR